MENKDRKECSIEKDGMNIPVISGIIAAVREWDRKKKLKRSLDGEYRALVLLDAFGGLDGTLENEVLVLKKKYQVSGLTEKEIRSVIRRIHFVLVEG